ncbi:carbohydrate ABC transporter permease [Rhodococcus sp. 14-2470-1a]|uniref:carbohydrate ABC transporter permease n=1 Tax=Rhodococcus sp. 14-2470-1a TaxID=2023150 RepID=UPI000B9A5FF8|nr:MULTISPECIES: sugar ABC transporter permease [unclassified Rhodococcus (in: high G+C Gram-positive bacteria)]OZE84994.1 sugar ABC transporter permease [Rhodococcus sp. 15-649-1-2]OZF50591.1 sugar ABC transporter permease [Rhodococcus sp. 14-2470-1a]
MPGKRKEAVAAAGFLAPSYTLLGVFVLIPLVAAFWVSLQRTDGFGSGTFTGLDNYSRLLSDPLFWRSLVNTLVFTALVTPLSMLFGLVAAVLLNSALPARPLWRALIILPMAVSGVATGLIGILIFDQNSGVLNNLLTFFGLPSIDWQSSPGPAFASIVIATVWWRTGLNMLIYLAGLQGLGPDLHEAARLDGAGVFQRFRYVTVPLLGPTSFFLLVLNVIYSFQVFDLVFVLTGGGPGGATSVLVTYAYETGFVTRDQGYAAAIGMVLFLFALTFAAAQWRASRTKDLVE